MVNKADWPSPDILRDTFGSWSIEKEEANSQEITSEF